MGWSRCDGLSEYRWPLLCLVQCLESSPAPCRAPEPGRPSSPAPNPGNVVTETLAKIHRSFMQRQLLGRSPELELVTVAVAVMAIVAAHRQVHRERATSPRPGLMQRASSVPLLPRPIRGPEPEQAQDLLHRDLSTNSVEVDT